MMQLDVDEAKAILDEYVPTIEACIRSAISEYGSLDSEQRARIQQRTKASIINDFMTFNAARELRKKPEVRLRRRHGQLTVLIEDKFRLKFKKLNHNLRPSSIETQSVLRFMNQQEELPGMPSVSAHIIAGYRWRDDAQTIADFYIICPEGKENKWELPITVQPIEAEATAIGSPIHTVETALQPGRRVIVPKHNV